MGTVLTSSMSALILLSLIPLVFGHGGIVWPPSWQNGKVTTLETVDSNIIASDNPVIDPTTNREIKLTTAFLTDAVFILAMALNMQDWGRRQTRR
eukprot:TRINITY_DN1650_c0_g1_i4.p2 TRINITY_DN1650_c0_g1~~TRINITY_DN1650_c0_g1_i4.p2  ORF type:complete len:103 (+),score=32.32 TRINITY_DN1650_c0_g1_i4:26-310(+)